MEELPGRASSGRASVLATWRAGGRGGPRSSRRSVAMQCRTRHWGRVFSPWPARAAVGKRGTGCAPGLPRPGQPGSTAFVSRVGNRSKRWQRGSSHLGAGARRTLGAGPSPEAKSALGSRRISRISRISSRISRTSRISRVIISRGQQVVWVEVVRGDPRPWHLLVAPEPARVLALHLACAVLDDPRYRSRSSTWPSSCLLGLTEVTEAPGTHP